MPGDSKAAEASPSSTGSALKAYFVPLILFSLSVFYQLVVLPRSFPPSHYDAFGIKRYSSIEEVEDAYQKLSSKWESGEEVPSVAEFIEVRYAYELLTNPIWKRDYDIFGIDEQLDVVNKVKLLYAGESFSSVNLPILQAVTCDLQEDAFDAITSENIGSMLNSSRPWLVLVHTSGSSNCAEYFNLWKQIGYLLEGVANTGLVELGDVLLSTSLAERKPTGQFFFRKGLPSIIAFPPGCESSDCLVRYGEDLSIDAITDWFATRVLGLPRILYHTKESLVERFLAKSGPHKVKVLLFSKTGQRASPFVRQTAKDCWAYASFALVLWREEDFSFWWNAFEVESAPAIVFIKDPGVKPVVFHGPVNNSWFSDIIEKNKKQELPQLRSVTSMELGCDARGHSRAGNDTLSWYCVILAGRLGPELNKMRETMRRVQTLLSDASELSEVDRDQVSLLASLLVKKRLTLAWLDGEAQQKYCLFYLHSETSYETCGPRRDLTDVPRLFIVRYKRNATQEALKVQKKPKNVWNVLHDEDVDPASQLVARYNGSNDISQIISWISETVRDGDNRDLPFFRAKTPDLVPEDSEPIWSRGAQSFLSKAPGLKNRFHGLIGSNVSDYLRDPRIGPILLLGSLMSCGGIWLMRSQQIPSDKTNRPSQSNTELRGAGEDETRPKKRERARNLAKKDQPPSLTDLEPKDAYQMPLSDSDSE